MPEIMRKEEARAVVFLQPLAYINDKEMILESDQIKPTDIMLLSSMCLTEPESLQELIQLRTRDQPIFGGVSTVAADIYHNFIQNELAAKVGTPSSPITSTFKSTTLPDGSVIDSCYFKVKTTTLEKIKSNRIACFLHLSESAFTELGDVAPLEVLARIANDTEGIYIHTVTPDNLKTVRIRPMTADEWISSLIQEPKYRDCEILFTIQGIIPYIAR